MCFYALAADFAAGAVAPALTIMEYQFIPHQPIARLSQLVAVSSQHHILECYTIETDTIVLGLNTLARHLKHHLGAVGKHFRSAPHLDRIHVLSSTHLYLVRLS